MRKSNPLLRPANHRVDGLSIPSQEGTGSIVSIRTQAGAARVQVCLGRRVASLVFVAAVVVELAALALVPATAGAASNPVTAYVTNFSSGTVTPIDLATNIPGSPIPAGFHPSGIAVTPDAKTAYVTNQDSGTVTPIDLLTNTPGNPIPVGSVPLGVAITPDGTTAYVTSYGSDTVTPISVATNTPGSPIPVDRVPIGIAITPDGKTAYVTTMATAR
jgi:YVTN family beta-propeller protein